MRSIRCGLTRKWWPGSRRWTRWHFCRRNDRRFMKSIKLILVLTMTLAAAAQATPRKHGLAVLNDLKVTPGATGTMTVKQLCDPNFHTGTIRNVPESMKQKVCAEYDIARADCTGKKYEIDHLISLELGGTNDRSEEHTSELQSLRH